MMYVVGRFGGLQALQEKSSYVMMDVVGRFGGLQALQEKSSFSLVLATTAPVRARKRLFGSGEAASQY